MTVREIVETLGLAADEDAVRKMAEYNAMVIAMSRKMNLTGIKDAEAVSYTHLGGTTLQGKTQISTDSA